MAETLGSLCDKLAIVIMKQHHATDPAMQQSLAQQAQQLEEEIDTLIIGAVSHEIPLERLGFASNKIYKKSTNTVAEVRGSLAQLIAHLMAITAKLWYVQEKIYAIEEVPVQEKDSVVKQQATLNLERNHCMDAINEALKDRIRSHDHGAA